MNKKAETNTPFIVIALVLAVAILASVSILLVRTNKTGNSIISPELLKVANLKCKNDGDSMLEQAKKFTDMDEDGYPDYCDVCISYTKKSSNKDDKDNDGMPDYCDIAPDDHANAACKKQFKIDKDRCIESAP